MEIFIIILLLLFGTTLLLAEVAIIPGFGIAGIGGICFTLGGIYFAYSQYGTTICFITIACVIVTFFIMLYFLSKSKTIEKMKLKSQIESRVEGQDNSNIAVGAVGVSTTRINLYGKVRIDEKTYQAKSLVFIDTNQPIEVVKIENSCILVQPKQNS